MNSGYISKMSPRISLTNMSPAGKSLKARRTNIPCDKKTLEKIREKHYLKRKAIETKDPLVRMQYNRIRNQVRRLTRNITKQYERGLATNAKENPKAIWREIC